MKTLAAIFATVLSLPASADTLVLQDGRTIEWTTVSDKGEFYEVETAHGKRVAVRKSDVKTLSRPSESPLTGASYVFDKGRQLSVVDILKSVDPRRDAISGSWRLASGAITGGGEPSSLPRLETPFVLPEEFDVSLVAERKEGADELFLGLSGGGRQFTVHFDAYQGGWTGLGVVDGKSLNDHGVGVPGKFFANGVPRSIIVMVRKNALVVKADGKDHFAWKADWSRVSMNPAFSVKSKGVLFIGVLSRFQISSIAVTIPKEK